MSKSSITIDDDDLLPNPHPGDILYEEFLGVGVPVFIVSEAAG